MCKMKGEEHLYIGGATNLSIKSVKKLNKKKSLNITYFDVKLLTFNHSQVGVLMMRVEFEFN